MANKNQRLTLKTHVEIHLGRLPGKPPQVPNYFYYILIEEIKIPC